MIYLLPIFTFILMLVFFGGYLFFKQNILFVLGIGAAVASNVYSVEVYGVSAGGFIWGIDAIIYTAFIFCVVVAMKDFDKKLALNITYSAMGGIFFTAVFDFFAKVTKFGYTTSAGNAFFAILVSVVATYVSVLIGLWIYEKLNKKVYGWVNMGITFIFINLFNTIMYFGITAMFDMLGETFVHALVGSLILKTISIVLFICTYYLCKLVKTKREKKLNNKKNGTSEVNMENDVKIEENLTK